MMFDEVVWVAIGAIGALLAGIPAFVDMIGKISARRADRQRLSGTSVRPAHPIEEAGGGFPVRIFVVIGAILLVLSGSVIAYRAGFVEWIKGSADPAANNVSEAVPEACDGADAGIKVATAGRWKGKRVTWDIYPDGSLDEYANGTTDTSTYLSGRWHINGDRFVAEFTDKTSVEGGIIGRTLCGTRFRNGRDNGIFWLDRTGEKLPPVETPSPAPSPEPPAVTTPVESVNLQL